ncbi:hypothetical protein V8E54_010075 [Elaphomyces granulatus]
MSQSFSTFDTITGGMHHGTLLLACGIIACNRYEGYLSTDAKGEERVEAHNEDVVPNGKYFYQLQDPATGSVSYAYLHMSFQDWRFPHDDIHVPWANIALALSLVPIVPVSTVSTTVLQRDNCCCISKHKDDVHRCHLCPKSENDWFDANLMYRFCINDAVKPITLRLDIHNSFDSKNFAIVKKKGAWVCHFLHPTFEKGRMYHNRKVAISEQVRPEFLLVRFAWTIFQSVIRHFFTTSPRLVMILKSSSWIQTSSAPLQPKPKSKRTTRSSFSRSKKHKASNSRDDQASGSETPCSTIASDSLVLLQPEELSKFCAG